VAHQPSVAIIGQLVGMAAEEAGNLSLYLKFCAGQSPQSLQITAKTGASDCNIPIFDRRVWSHRRQRKIMSELHIFEDDRNNSTLGYDYARNLKRCQWWQDESGQYHFDDPGMTLKVIALLRDHLQKNDA